MIQSLSSSVCVANPGSDVFAPVCACVEGLGDERVREEDIPTSVFGMEVGYLVSHQD